MLAGNELSTEGSLQVIKTGDKPAVQKAKGNYAVSGSLEHTMSCMQALLLRVAAAELPTLTMAAEGLAVSLVRICLG